MKFLFKAVYKHVDDLITYRLIAFHRKMIEGGQIAPPTLHDAGVTVGYKEGRVAGEDQSL